MKMKAAAMRVPVKSRPRRIALYQWGNPPPRKLRGGCVTLDQGFHGLADGRRVSRPHA
jgi:hypothetical protein